MITIVFLHGDKCPNMAIRVRIWRYVFLHGDYMFLRGDKCTCSADHEHDWQPYPVDLYPCYDICDDYMAIIMVFLHGDYNSVPTW